MRIGKFFHKIKIWFSRIGGKSIPYVSQAKKYGTQGEDEFVKQLQAGMPSCEIKRNVLINTAEGKAEIDCLILFQNKLFAIEIKRWKGRIIEETEDKFLQEKTDRWTGEIHSQYHKSPFKQLNRAIFLLRKQVPINAWINGIVFFEADELESVSIRSNNIFFYRIEDLVLYIQNDGRELYGAKARAFFKKCIQADCLYAKSAGKSLNCIILDDSLRFQTEQGIASRDTIASIHITHHWFYDELRIKMADGSERCINLENAKIEIDDNGTIRKCSLCKLNRIELGNAMFR